MSTAPAQAEPFVETQCHALLVALFRMRDETWVIFPNRSHVRTDFQATMGKLQEQIPGSGICCACNVNSLL